MKKLKPTALVLDAGDQTHAVMLARLHQEASAKLPKD